MRIRGTIKRRISGLVPLRFTAAIYGRPTEKCETPGRHMHAEHQTWWMWRGRIWRQNITALCCADG